jgi:hypothetical protein
MLSTSDAAELVEAGDPAMAAGMQAGGLQQSDKLHTKEKIYVQ